MAGAEARHGFGPLCFAILFTKKRKDMKALSVFIALLMLVAFNKAAPQNMPYDRTYNPNSVTTIHGIIKSVERIPTIEGGAGIHLMVETDAATIPVHLGPQWYIDDQEITFSEGDEVTVTGSHVNIDNEPAIIAKTVKKGKAALTLRRDNGTPLWSGKRRS